jgi:hypothetical protein
MRTIADTRNEVMLAVLDDRDRSLEGAVERALQAGVDFERERIRSILMLSVPPGLERALVELALCPTATVDQAAGFFAAFPLDPTHSAKLRNGFRVVTNEQSQEIRHA